MTEIEEFAIDLLEVAFRRGVDGDYQIEAICARPKVDTYSKLFPDSIIRDHPDRVRGKLANGYDPWAGFTRVEREATGTYLVAEAIHVPSGATVWVRAPARVARYQAVRTGPNEQIEGVPPFPSPGEGPLALYDLDDLEAEVNERLSGGAVMQWLIFGVDHDRTDLLMLSSTRRDTSTYLTTDRMKQRALDELTAIDAPLMAVGWLEERDDKGWFELRLEDASHATRRARHRPAARNGWLKRSLTTDWGWTGPWAPTEWTDWRPPDI